MRVTGAADITEDFDKTLPGKLPQRVISKTALAGFSSYGNQIGLATGGVYEMFDEGYKAKRLETGYVIGGAPAENVRREQPRPGDGARRLRRRDGQQQVAHGKLGGNLRRGSAERQSARGEKAPAAVPQSRSG